MFDNYHDLESLDPDMGFLWYSKKRLKLLKKFIADLEEIANDYENRKEIFSRIRHLEEVYKNLLGCYNEEDSKHIDNLKKLLPEVSIEAINHEKDELLRLLEHLKHMQSTAAQVQDKLKTRLDSVEQVLPLLNKYKHLEVLMGPGEWHPNSLILQKNWLYLCYDFFYGENLERLSRKIDAVKLLSVSASETGLPNECADKVSIFNVFNDNHVRGGDEIFTEAVRIVKKDGSIFVGADNTPHFFTLNNIKHSAEKHGLHCEVLIYFDSDRDETKEEKELFEKLSYSYFTGVYGAYLVKITK